MLELKKVNTFFEKMHILKDISINVKEGEIVAVLGANGSGKSTLLGAIMNLYKSTGTILFKGVKINNLPTHKIVELGITLIPEDRKLFSEMTVKENLILGAYTKRAKARIKENLKRVYDLFPILKEREHQPALSLSGGEQRMLALARGLMSDPELLMLDEPSQGLAPKIFLEIFNVLTILKKTYGLSILLTEQNVYQTLKIADRVYILEEGRIALEGTAQELSTNEYIKKAFLGI